MDKIAMEIKNKLVPEKIHGFLKTQPETGMGYQIVTAFLNDGAILERVQILDASNITLVNGSTEIPFNASDIERVELTHDFVNFVMYVWMSARSTLVKRSYTHPTTNRF